AGVEESLILDRWAAHLEPVLILRPRYRRILQAGLEFALLVEVFVRVQHLVAEIFIDGTMPTVGARLRAQVHDAAGELAPFGALIVSLDFVLADGVLGWN